MKIVIRTDASIKMGSGHVMRCLNLGESLREKGATITFVSRKHVGNINHLLTKKDFQVIELEKPKCDWNENKQSKEIYRDWLGVSENQDAEDTIRAIGIERPDWLIVDHYSLGEIWENRLRPFVKNIFVIDDIANRQHDCDLLLNQNWFQNFDTCYDDLVPLGCAKLLGPKYALLRPEFAELRKTLKSRDGTVKRVFVFFGGSDPRNLTGMTLRAFLDPELVHFKVDVVIGENNPHQDEILKMTEESDNINLHIQVNNMATIMAKADLAIGAGGVNTWERISLSLPSIVISVADNQQMILNYLNNKNMIHLIGNFNKINKNIIKDNIIKLCNNPSIIKNQIDRIKNVLKGTGLIIVTDFLIGNFSNSYWKVKKANRNNLKLYWIWANDKKVRENSLIKGSIPFDEHVIWFENKLANNKCSLFLIFIENIPVGQVRFDIENDFARIDYSIAKQFRGRRIAKRLLSEAINKFRKNNSIKILGEILPENLSSSSTFKSLGFDLNIIGGNMIYTKEVLSGTQVKDSFSHELRCS